jgi:hypothetical protein
MPLAETAAFLLTGISGAACGAETDLQKLFISLLNIFAFFD